MITILILSAIFTILVFTYLIIAHYVLAIEISKTITEGLVDIKLVPLDLKN